MTQTVPDISPLMPMHQDPLLVASICAYIFNPTNTEVAQLSTTWRRVVGAAPGIHPDGEQPKTVLWLWVREITWYLYTRWVRGRMKAKQRYREWFHHFRHHVHDGHWTGEFATVIWRLHCRTPQWARGQFTRSLLYQTGSKNGVI